MVVTLSEVKSILQITSSTYDTLISMLIPLVEQSIIDYCNNDFIDENFNYILSTAIKFNSSDNSIELSGIESMGLVANDTIRIYGSLRNDSAYTISSIATPNKLILNTINTLITEDENKPVSLVRIKYPITFKFTAAQMINVSIQKTVQPGLISETIDDHTMVFDKLINNYPSTLMSSLNNYRSLFKPTVTDVMEGLII